MTNLTLLHFLKQIGPFWTSVESEKPEQNFFFPSFCKSPTSELPNWTFTQTNAICYNLQHTHAVLYKYSLSHTNTHTHTQNVHTHTHHPKPLSESICEHSMRRDRKTEQKGIPSGYSLLTFESRGTPNLSFLSNISNVLQK